jgi:glycosyltransferase involved in cell wall biosynthesis
MSVLISIIVPCFNQAQYLDECLQSVLNQTNQNWECIIVNDGSPDNTEEIALEWCKKDPRFTYLKKENGGPSSARNAGIDIANGKYLLPLDSDDKISSNYLSACLKEIEACDEIKIVYGKAFKFGLVNKDWKLPDYTFESLLRGNMIFCTALYRKSDWKKAGGYDENMKFGIEDWELWINIMKDGGLVIRNSDCFFYYRIKETSRNLTLGESLDKSYLMQRYVFNNHFDLYNINVFDLYLNNLRLEKLENYLTLTDLLLLLLKRIKIGLISKFNVFIKK